MTDIYDQMVAAGDVVAPEDYDEDPGDLSLPDWQLPFTPTPVTDESVTHAVDGSA